MFGLPVSTTHVLSSGVAGTMAANGSGLQMVDHSQHADGLGADAAGCDRVVGRSVLPVLERVLILEAHCSGRRQKSELVRKARARRPRLFSHCAEVFSLRRQVILRLTVDAPLRDLRTLAPVALLEVPLPEVLILAWALLFVVASGNVLRFYFWFGRRSRAKARVGRYAVRAEDAVAPKAAPIQFLRRRPARPAPLAVDIAANRARPVVTANVPKPAPARSLRFTAIISQIYRCEHRARPVDVAHKPAAMIAEPPKALQSARR